MAQALLESNDLTIFHASEVLFRYMISSTRKRTVRMRQLVVLRHFVLRHNRQ